MTEKKKKQYVRDNARLMAEWNWEQNNKLDYNPNTLTCGSDKKVWWKCNKGHEWSATIGSRNRGCNCPQCAKERQSSYPEKALYYYVHNIFNDAIASYKFNELNSLELDIFIPSLQIAIEYDGQQWHRNINRDIAKNAVCKEKGIKLIRVREPGCPILPDSYSINIILQNKKSDLEKAICKVVDLLETITGVNYHLTIDLNKDNTKILELISLLEKENSIVEKCPNLIREWDYDKNGKLSPSVISAGSDKKVWWICEKGHSYLASVSGRLNGKGCSICAGKTVLEGFNDFASKCPSLLTEWDYEKNNILPNAIPYGSDAKIWWKCKMGHSYTATINNKRAGAKCPFCSGKKVLLGFNDITTTHPKIVQEWDFKKNELQPTKISAGSHKAVWWKCTECGFEWKSTIYNRTSGHGCPQCAKNKKGPQKKDHKYFLEQLSIINPNIQIISTYEGANKKIDCKCKICGYLWSTTPSNLLRGHGCSKCANKKAWEKRKSMLPIKNN